MVRVADPPTPTRYVCRAGLAHLVVGQEIVPGDANTFCKWTACGKFDVPVEMLPVMVFPQVEVTCLECRLSKEFGDIMRMKAWT